MITNYELTDDIIAIADRKVGSVRKFLGKPEKPAIAYVDLGKFTEAHHSGAVWYAETNIEVDGERFVAKAEAESLRSAIDKMAAELARELGAAKKKREALARKGGSRLKNLFRFGG